jgi:potassium large conductance calcium-activated channel subfamily M alpha protein 1
MNKEHSHVINEDTPNVNRNGNEDCVVEKFDSTGMFHWTEEQKFEDCVLNGHKKQSFANHVIVCVFAEPNSPLIGLRNFVLPLRASNYYYHELKRIVFIGNRDFLYKEWKTISNFPKIYMLPVS